MLFHVASGAEKLKIFEIIGPALRALDDMMNLHHGRYSIVEATLAPLCALVFNQALAQLEVRRNFGLFRHPNLRTVDITAIDIGAFL